MKGNILTRVKTKIAKYLIQRCPIRPLSDKFGFDRGTPIDRYYIDNFLNKNKHFLLGDVLEVSESFYTNKYSDSTLTNALVFSYEDASGVDFVGDLSSGVDVPENVADCFIMTQTLPVIFDFKAAVKNALKMLRPGGCLLITVPGITQISRYDYERWGHFWSFTDMSLKRILESNEIEELVVESFGNVKAACAFLYGLAAHEIKKEDLDYNDKNYQILITAVLRKKGK